MKKYLPTILTGLSCVLLGVTLVQNHDLKRQISEIESNLWNQISYVENTVNGLTYNIESTLEKEAAFLIDDNWGFRDAEVEKGTVTAILEVMPKEYQPDKTKAVIICSGEKYPMVLDNGVYRAEVPVALFEETRVDRVTFEADGIVRAENLNWSLTPRYEFLPIVYSHYSGGTTGTPNQETGLYELRFDGELQIDVDAREGAGAVRSISIVETVDNQEIARTEIPLAPAHAGELLEASGNQAAAEVLSGELPAELIPGSFMHEFDQKKVSFPFGSTYGMYVEVEDGFGLLHRAWAWREKISETGEPVDDDHWWWRGAEGSIFSKDGEPLSVHDGEFF